MEVRAFLNIGNGETHINMRDQKTIMQKYSIIKDLNDIKSRIESIIETLEIMSDEEFAKSIERGVKEAERGELREFEEILNDLQD